MENLSEATSSQIKRNRLQAVNKHVESVLLIFKQAGSRHNLAVDFTKPAFTGFSMLTRHGLAGFVLRLQI